jgi:hypothetical protein
MFGRLKRRRDEEEAPLVPHGFLWQATDASESPDEEKVELAKPATFEDNQSTSEEVEMPANATPQPENAAPRKLGAISPPLQWPSPNIQEIARHPEARPVPHIPAMARLQEKKEPPIVNAPAASSVVKDVSPSRPGVATLVGEQTRAWSRAVSANLRSAMSYCGSFAKTVSSQMSRAIKSFRTELHDVANRANLKGRILNARNITGKKLSQLQQRSSGIGATATSKLSALQQTAIVRSRSELHKSAERLRSVDLSWPTRSLQRIRNLKVTIRIPRRDSARITAALSAIHTPWNRVRNSMDRDSRLWTSMAMAGLSALIALAVVSGLNRYQPGSSLGVVAAHSPDPTTAVPDGPRNLVEVGRNKVPAAALIAPATKQVVASSAAERPSPAVPKQPQTTPEPTELATLKSSTPAVAKTATAHKPRRLHFGEDDDYIAKDTYVVYGSNGKPVRR